MRRSSVMLLLALVSCRSPAPRSDDTASANVSDTASTTPARTDRAGDTTESSRMPVELQVEAPRFRAGAEITLTLVNRSDATYAFNPCTRTVERESGGGWTAVREDRMCTMEAWLLDARARRTAKTELPEGIGPGRYRVIVALTRETSDPSAERVNAVSAPFSVEP